MSRYPICDNVNRAAGRAVSAGTTALVMVPICQRNRTAVISVVEKETDPPRTTGKSASRSAAVSISDAPMFRQGTLAHTVLQSFAQPTFRFSDGVVARTNVFQLVRP